MTGVPISATSSRYAPQHAPIEILPGVVYWTAPHPHIRSDVSSYWIELGGVLVDPLVPLEGGLDWFKDRDGSPNAIVLSNRHHTRESDRFAARFGCVVHAPRSGLHEPAVRELGAVAYDPGDSLPGGLTVHEIGSLCPDDMALHLRAARAVLFADGVVLARAGGDERVLGFVSDRLMDDPPRTKRGLLAALRRLLDQVQFDHVLCAHGGPLLGGRTQLEELVRIGGRTAFEL